MWPLNGMMEHGNQQVYNGCQWLHLSQHWRRWKYPNFLADMSKGGWNGGWITRWSWALDHPKFPADETYGLLLFRTKNKRIVIFSQRWPRHNNCKGQSRVEPFQTHNTIPQRTRSGKVHLFHYLSFCSRKVALNKWKEKSLDGILQKRRAKIKQLSVGITDSFIIPDGKLVKCHCRLC